MLSRTLGLFVLAACLVPLVTSSACGEKKGGLMLSVSTDMKAPKDVSVVSLTILTNNQVKYNFIGRVLPNGEVKLPATLAIAEPDDANASIRIRVVAFQERKPRVLRDVRTSVPRGGRTALLRVPLNFIDDGSALGELTQPQLDGLPSKGVVPNPVVSDGGGGGGAGDGGDGGQLGGASLHVRADGFGAGEFDPYQQIDSICGAGDTLTSVNGVCVDSFVDSGALPDFEPALVGDGQDPGACFDAKRCLAAAVPLPVPGELDVERCTVALRSRDLSKLNLALRTSSVGECVAPGQCYVPVDKGEQGWREAGSVIQLAPGICKKLGPGVQLVEVQNGPCAPKEARVPVCNGVESFTPDGGRVDGSGSPQGNAGLVSAEQFPNAITVSPAGELFIASQTRLVRKPLNGQSTEIPGIVPVVAPWRVSNAALGPVALVNGSSSAYLLGPDGAAKAITFGGAQPPSIIDVSPFAGPDFIFGGGTFQAGNGGLFQGNASTGGAALTCGLAPTDVTSVVTTAVAQLPVIALGTLQGGAGLFSFSFNECMRLGPNPVNTLAGGRIDQLIASPSNPAVGYALVAGVGIVGISFDVTNGIVARNYEVGDAETLGVTPPSSPYYPHAMVAFGKCIFYSAAGSVRYFDETQPFPKRTELVLPTKRGPVLGIAAAANLPTIGNTIFYTQYGPLGDAAQSFGGVYQVPAPAECF